MLILTIRTDKPQAELGLYEDQTQLTYISWEAHRQLAESIHLKIQEVLQDQNCNLNDIRGIVIFMGPGSFTGLRIGAAVANALAASLAIPIAGTNGEDWLQTGISNLKSGQDDKIIIPEYGAPARTTKPRK